MFVTFYGWSYLIESYSICHIHIALYHVQQQLKLSDLKQFYKHFNI